MDEDLHIDGGDIADVINQEARRLEALRVRAANGDGELPISIFFSQGVLLDSAALKKAGIFMLASTLEV